MRAANQFIVCALLACVLFAGQTSAIAQEESAELQALDKKMSALAQSMSQAQAMQVHYLSPSEFQQASVDLADARAELNGKCNVAVISEKLRTAEAHLVKAVGNSSKVKKELPDLVAAREDALAADAPIHASPEYESAAALFRTAVGKIEADDLTNAVVEGKKAEEAFRTAELKAIKTSIIGPVHDLLREAAKVKADKYSPISYKRAQSLLQEAEQILVSNRRAQASARQKAEEATYEAQHAAHIAARVAELRKSEQNWEKLILDFEAAVRPAAEALNIAPHFEKGFTEPLENLATALQALKVDRRELNQQLGQTQKELTELQAEKNHLTGQLDATRQQEETLKANLAAKKRFEEKMRRVESLFDENEAIVLREKGNLILRLTGISFPSGKSDIEVQYFSLLTKVQQVLREFPGAPVTIEGHTDSRGHDIVNTRLSNERANAIKAYLVANLGLDESGIVAVGYGKSRPIATNDTEEGRRVNRRIDVVVAIGDALY